MRPAAVLAFCAVLSVARAGAAEEPRIVLVAPRGEDRVALRIRAELRALRFVVVDADAAPGPPSRAPLEEAARSHDAVAAVRIVPSSAGVEVWIVDRVTGKTVLRDIVAADVVSPSGSATVALRVVELLRASLMELDAPRPPPGEMLPPLAVRDLIEPAAPAPRPLGPLAPPARPPRPAFAVEIGPAVLVSAGGLHPEGVVSAAVHFRPDDRLGATYFVMAPVVPSTVAGPEGAATIWIGLLGAGLRASLAPAGAAWTPSLGAGVSALWVAYEGSPADGYAGTNGDAVTLAPYLRAGLGYRVLPRLRVKADLLSGVPLRRPVVQFGDRIAAVWGEPFFAPSIGVEYAW
jgi:hypothetical protein